MRIRKKHLLYFLTLLSAGIGAAVVGIDSAILYRYVTDPWVFGVCAFLVGAVITVLISLVLSIKFQGKNIGSFIDPSFSGVRFLSKKEIPYHILAGIGNAITSIGYFYIISELSDPSIALSFTYVVILYLLGFECFSEKSVPTIADVQSTLIVVFGAMLGSISLSGNVDLKLLAVVFLVVNPFWALFSMAQRKLKLIKIKERYNDAINIRMWNVIFTALFTSAIVLLIRPISFYTSLEFIPRFYPLFILSMSATFFSYVLYIRALGIGKASTVQSLYATSLIFSMPVGLALSAAGYILMPQGSGIMLLIRGIGISLVLLGVVSFALTEVKGYVFVKVQIGYHIREILNRIWDIKGVESVSAVTGKYSLVAKVRTRTLGKGYEQILSRLEEIEGIEDFKWFPILKEWENM